MILLSRASWRNVRNKLFRAFTYAVTFVPESRGGRLATDPKTRKTLQILEEELQEPRRSEIA